MYEKYIGRSVTIIYEDQKGNITQRTVLIKSVVMGKIKAYDYTRRAPRIFDIDRILSLQPNRHVS